MYAPVAVFVILFSAALADNDPCVIPGQLKADPDHCNQFLQCMEGVWVTIRCQRRLLFNPKTLSCDLAKNVKCSNKLFHGVKFDLEPCDHVGDLKPDTKNCDRFYQCTNDGWASIQCQPPTLFNPKILRCDWAKNVDCATN